MAGAKVGSNGLEASWQIASGWQVETWLAIAIVASLLTFLLRRQFHIARRFGLTPVAITLEYAALTQWSRARFQYWISCRRWYEITLFSEYDAPSRLVFGLLGASIVALSLTLSYRGLLPTLFNSIESQNSSAGSDPLRTLLVSREHTLMITLFEAAIGFICLEMFGLTNVLRISARYKAFPWVRKLAGISLLAMLLMLGVTEAWTSLVSDEIRFDAVCQEKKLTGPPCNEGLAPYSWLSGKLGWSAIPAEAPAPASTSTPLPTDTPVPKANPLRLPNDPSSTNDGQLRLAQAASAADRAVHIAYTKAWFDVISAIVMPFSLMIVGLALDFLEEMYLPATSLGFAMFHTVTSVLFLAFSKGLWVTTWMLSLAGTVLMAPTRLFVALWRVFTS
ncbi:MAG TPA: hypothetical protein VMH86_09195 [Rhizomicrobium sp.]|nr:hypothetical protein [Rhizomicrobium sp.]